MAHELDQKIQDLYKRIQTERSYIAASEKVRRATTNQEVLRRNDAQIRESQRSLSYFEETLRDLQARKAQTLRQPTQQQRRSDDSSGPSGGGQPASPRQGGSSDRDRALPMPPPTSPDDYGVSQYPGYSSTSPELPRPKQYSNLDLIKAETPYTTAKITRMLEQLEFKLQVENQYKKAIQQMTKLYQQDGDKKSRADADVKRIESDKKIQLLQIALKRYRNLHIIDDPQSADDEQHPAEGDRKDNLRKPLSGKLYITIREARDLDHAPLLKRSSKVFNDTTVVLKVEGTARANSLPSRTDKWNQEFEISVDKANEVEVAIFDRQTGGDGQTTPIGLLWLRLNDVVEALRRQRVGTEAQGAWVTAAGAMRDGHGPGGSPPHDAVFGQQQQQMGFGGQPGPDAAPNQLGSEGITAWFAVEPAGALALDVNFVKENVRRRPVDAGKLGRQGAVRMRPREVHEMNGHKFVARQFYQIMMCAYCSDFLLKASGYQCEDCRYTCHRECYPKVVTKCISKSNADTEADEDKINHRIPHRFETITNIRANWCCHCGYMLPLGRKNAKKCSECDITCHASCTHLVPDFCGMTMEKANALLHQIQEIKSHQKQMQPAKGRKQSPSQSISQSPTSPPMSHQQWGSPPQQDIYSDFNRMSISGPPQGQGHGRTSSSTSLGPGAGYPITGGPVLGQPGMPPPIQQQPTPPGKSSFEGAPYRPSQETEGPGSLPPKPVRVDQYGRPIPDKQPTYPPPITQQAPDRPPSIVQQQLPPQVVQKHQIEQPLPLRQQTIQKPHRKVGLDDFNFLAVLGKGNFGKVMLAEEKKTNGLYAIKVLKKEFIIDNDEVESTQSEKRVFLTAARERHPFLLGLHSCFQTETRVYFVMEYVSGGDLMLHIQRKQFSLRQAKFYAAEVLLALEYFHANGIIYRDLKLDNILLTLDGHVKVADYGLCKEEMGYGQTTGTFCGTPEFMAPEILLEQRYGRAVDWWAFGVLMYEMLLGQSPFRGDDEDEIFDAILEDEPLYPITMPRDAVSILQRLLTRDPNRRLGSGPNDAEDIKAHPFFKDTNFDDVFHKRIPPPYYPSISNSTDVSNFDSEFTREQPTLTPVHGQLSLADQNQFVGFSWVAAWADN